MKKISIGKRNVKTAISVFIAINFSLILIVIDKSIGNPGDGFSGLSGMYTPFFAGIAAAYTSHKDYKSSLKQAKIRSVGSVIGGLFGMVIILLVETLFKSLVPIDNLILYKFIEYTFVSIGVIFLIYINVKTKQTDATFISCLTYLSVTISIRNGGMPIVQFAANRILSTLIGVGIALVVNNVRIIFHKNKDVLFIANIDNDINYKSYPLSYTRYKINDMYQRDTKLVLHTEKSGVDQVLFKDVHINKQLILMNGVCIYDAKSKDYIYSCDFTDNARKRLNEYLKKRTDVFTYVIHDLRLAVHHEGILTPAAMSFYKNERENNSYPFIEAPVLDYHDVAMYELVIKDDEFDELNDDILKMNIATDIIMYLESLPKEGYSLVKIKPVKALRVEAVKNLPYYDECSYKVAFISNEIDLKIADLADFKICLDNADEEIKKISDYIVKSNNFNDVLKLFAKIYHTRNLEKCINKLRNKKSR